MPNVVVCGLYEIPEANDVHLVEVAVDAPPGEVNVGAFQQEDPALPPDSWQVAYNEWYLDEEGNPLSEFEYEGDPTSATRLAFFLHFVDFARPLLTPFGPVALPQPNPLPDRLREIEYPGVD